MRKLYKFIPMLVGIVLLLGFPLFASGQTVTELPFSENWDVDQDPLGWTFYTNSAVGDITVQSTIYHSANYAVDMANSTDETSDFLLILPETQLATAGTRLMVYAKHQSAISAPQSFKVGVMTDPADINSYTNVYNSGNLSSTWTEYIVDLSAVPPQSGAYHIVIQGVFNGTNKHIYFDNIVWEEVPTSPLLSYTPNALDFGMVFLGDTSSTETVTLSNYGINVLSVSNISITGPDAADFLIEQISETLPFDLFANSANNMEVDVAFIPLTESAGMKDASLEITHSEGTSTVALTGECPDGLQQIGYGTSTSIPLPMNGYYGYSYSQSIFLQSEIDIADKRISRVYYQSNTNSWSSTGQINIYMGHTTQSALTDWIPVVDMQEVHYEEVIPVGDDDGWHEFVLTVPFIYNNTDNLVIAFDENTPSYSNIDHDFYTHSTTDNKSIRYYSDGTNPDPTAPPTGTLEAHRPNVRLYFEDLPTEPVLGVTPDSHDFETAIVLTTNPIDFTVRNTGIGTLSITDISLGGDNAAEFELSNLPTFPLEQTNDQADAHTFTVSYNPTIEGDVSAYIIFANSQGTDSIPLVGNGYDATISELPWEEGFDNPATTTLPEITLGWNLITDFTSSSAYLETAGESVAYSAPNYLKGYNSSDVSPTMLAVTPPVTVDVTNLRIKLMAYGDATLKIGIMSDNNDETTFTEIASFELTSEWEEYIIDCSSLAPIAGNYFIGFKADLPLTYDYVRIDDINLMEIPTEPIAELTPETYEFPLVPMNQVVGSGADITLRNFGGGTLTITSFTGLDGTDFSLAIDDIDTVAIQPLESRVFPIEYLATTEGDHAATATLVTNGGTIELNLSGSAYALPDGMIEIGWGDATGQNLPMYNYYSYSYSQSLYKQSEINTADSKITSVFYHKTSNVGYPEAGDIDIYIGYTTLDEMTDWVSIDNLTHVTFSETLPVGDAEDWVEFVLDEPFIYNNVDNLIIAFDENLSGYGSLSDDFYCHATSGYMSARYYADYTNPDPANPPAISSLTGNPGLKAYRPNIRLQFEEMPTTPLAVFEPGAWDAGMRPVGYSVVSETYTLTNLGVDPLLVTSATDLSGTPFSTTFVADSVNLPLGMNYEFSFEFAPTTVGDYEIEFIIETNGINDTVLLTGTCDYSLPANVVEVGWGIGSVDLPMEPASKYTYSQSIYKQSEIDMSGQAIHHIYYRQTSETPMNEDIKVYMAHYPEENLDANWEILGNLVEVYDGVLGSPNAQGWIKISLDIPFPYNNTSNLIVAFDENGENEFSSTDSFYGHATDENLSRANTSNATDVDPATISGGELLAERPNIRFEFGAPATDPLFSLNLNSWDAGTVPGNQSANSGEVFRITNLGGGTLEITDAVFLNGTVFSTSLVASEVSLAAGEEYYFSMTYAPLEVGAFSDSLIITHDEGADTITLIGDTDYVIPENMVEIGAGTVVNAHLPMEPYYGYSYSQSLFLQPEIYMQDMRISKLYYQRDAQNDLGNAGDIYIYMGHTAESTLTDWIPLTELQEVTYSDVLPIPNSGGWVEFILTVPFTYNNTDNLVIAFDENKSSWDGEPNEFYNHTTDNDMSIWYYSDVTNPDPASPPSGTLSTNRPNVRLQFEEIPTTPLLSANPDTYDYGFSIVGIDYVKPITVRNFGIDTLIINNIYVGGENAIDFTLTELPTLPIELTNSVDDLFIFNAIFNPTAEGDLSGKIYFEHNEGIDSIMLYGNGYDATITEIPWSEHFDDPLTTPYPDMTLGWNTILETTNTYADIKVYNYTYLTEPYCVRFYNSDDNDPSSEYMLVTPRTQLDPTGTRLRFFADGYSGDQLIVGYMTDPTDATTFVEVETVDLETDYTQHYVDLSSIATAGYYHLAFKANFAGTYHYIYLDNVTWENSPTTPVFEAMPASVDFGDVSMFSTTDDYTVEVRNSGIGELIITDAEIIGVNADQFSLTVVDELNDTITPVYTDFMTVQASFSPTLEGVLTADIQFTDVDLNTYTVPLTGTSINVTMYPDTLVNFEEAVPPLFWDMYTGLLSENTTLSPVTYGWTHTDYTHISSETKAAKLNIYGSSRKHWLITSPIDLGDGTNPVKLEFDLALTKYYYHIAPVPAPDDRFAIVISTDNGETWSEANALRIWDNDESDYVFDDIPLTGEHVEISLSDYSGIVQIGIYGESTVSNGDNDLFVDNFEFRFFTPEELALLDAEENTSMTVAPELTVYEEANTAEHAIVYTVTYPNPFDANLDALLMHDFMVQFNTAIPVGTTIDVEFDGTNVGQFTADGVASDFWISDVTGAAYTVLSAMENMTVTLKINGLNTIGEYDVSMHSYTAYDGQFGVATAHTMLASAMAEVNVTPTPVTLPIMEDFEDGIPTDWSTDNSGDESAEWQYVLEPAFGSTTGDNGYMRINASAAPEVTNADLITYSINMSEATETVMLEFEHYYDDISLTTATVYLSTDIGVTWTEVEQYTSDIGSMNEPVLASIDITEYVLGQENVIIRWNYNDNGIGGQTWNIDDVNIFEFIPNTEAEIITFELADQVSSSIDDELQVVQVVMPNGTDLTALAPIFTLSDGATAAVEGLDQESEISIVDFSTSIETPVIYTVTAEDNVTTKDWEVTVSTENALANAGAFNFAVYPNPSNGKFDLNVYSKSGFTYSIYAVDGKLIHNAQVSASGEVTEAINLENIAPGVYTLKVNADDVIKVEKLIIE